MLKSPARLCTSNWLVQNRTDLLRHLKEINWQLERCEFAIDELKGIVTALCVSGGDATEATRLLSSMETEQDRRVEEYGRLLDALDHITVGCTRPNPEPE